MYPKNYVIGEELEKVSRRWRKSRSRSRGAGVGAGTAVGAEVEAGAQVKANSGILGLEKAQHNFGCVEPGNLTVNTFRWVGRDVGDLSDVS